MFLQRDLDGEADETTRKRGWLVINVTRLNWMLFFEKEIKKWTIKRHANKQN